MGYFQQTLNGYSWVGLSRGSSRVIGFARMAILARILTPGQFGAFGVAALTLAFLEMITETGINVVLIQDENENALSKYLNTAWVVSIIRGLLVCLILILVSPLIVGFFNSPESKSLLLTASLIPLIRGLINPSVVKFQKDLDFHLDFWFKGSLMLVESLVAIILAFVTRSPISMVLALVISAAMEVIISHLFVGPKPKFRIIREQVSYILSRGKWITSAGVLGYLTNKGSEIATGRMLDNQSLGFYQMASRVSLIPISEIVETSNRVTFPIYSKIAGDKNRLQKAFLKNYAAVVLISIPICLLIFLFAPLIVGLLLGPQWVESIPIVRMLAITGIFISLSATFNPLFLSLNKQKFISHLTMIELILLLIVIMPLTYNFGALGAAFALLFSIALTIPLRCYLAWKTLK